MIRLRREHVIYKRRWGRYACLSLLPVLLLVALVLACAIGSVSISPLETLQILLHKLGILSGRVSWSLQDEQILWVIRLPRVLSAVLVGASLAVAGCLFQAVLRNPLADPYVMGTSAGAQLGVTVALLFPTAASIAGFGLQQLGAFLGAVLTVLFVYGLARRGGGTPIVILLLAGFVTSSFLISATTLLFDLGGQEGQVLHWTLGSLSAVDTTQLAVGAPICLFGLILAALIAHPLDVILLGEEAAGYLGIRVERLKLGAILLASLLTALAVALAGIVAFVGLVVPHAMRLVYGPGHRLLVPASAVGGAVFVLLADLVARALIPPVELPLGVVTAVIGAPFFLHLLRRSRHSYGV